jgi:endonuclease YncB( thermonuclease family)
MGRTSTSPTYANAAPPKAWTTTYATATYERIRQIMNQVALMWRFGLLALVFASAAHAETDNDTIPPSAKPRFQVVDGDTVKFGPQLVRLFGIDAPEKGQTCDDGQWHPGPLAKKALVDFIASRPVTCKQVNYDARNNRPVAQCFAGEDDLQAMMVSAGWAWSFGRYSERYAPEEKEAANRKAGVHAHRCVPPWEWRAQQRAKISQ